MPAVYYHSLFGSGPDHEGMRTSGITRRINRARARRRRAASTSCSTDPRRSAVFDGLRALLRSRRGQPALSPYGAQAVEAHDDRVLVLRRGAGTPDELVCVTNVTASRWCSTGRGTDVLTGAEHRPLRLGPYGYAWLRPD